MEEHGKGPVADLHRMTGRGARIPFGASANDAEPPPDWGVLRLWLKESLLADSDSLSLGVCAMLDRQNDLLPFYLMALQPALYDIGMLWEHGKISVAQEHRASARAGRILSSLHAAHIHSDGTTGRAVVASVTNDYHEMGAWIIAEALEIDNWEVRYLGASPPRETIVELVTRFSPDLLALSVTLLSNIGQAREVIAAVRCEPRGADTPVLVGGQALNHSPDSWRDLGADAYAPDVASAVSVARRLRQTRRAQPERV